MRAMPAQHAVLALVLLVTSTNAGAAVSQAPNAAPRLTAAAIRYTVTVSAPQTHYLEVAAVVPTAGRRSLEMMMAVWTPGSYLVREYARHVEAVTATADSRPVPIEKTAKNRWLVQTLGAAAVTISYRVYAHELSQRTNWVDVGFALINGAPTFMTLADSPGRPHEVVLSLPPSWSRSMSGLPALPGGDHRYVAADFDTLVDSPILAGTLSVHEFAVDGKRHSLVSAGDTGGFDGARAATDFETLVREHQRFWGALPYERYVALNVIGEDRGALEHKNSAVLMTASGATRTRRAYVRFLSVLSHEFFHAWNGKRLRPVELGPFDYEKEAPSRGLWIVEGFSDYYGDLLAHRAGLMTRAEFLGNLSAAIEEVQTTPGRHVQSVELASFDAWIKYYRPDENSANSSISYYSKGAVLAFLLDARIRRLTNGARSLDDVLRAAYDKYSGTRGFTSDQFREVVEQVAGTKQTDFWNAFVSGTQELDYSDALTTFGLRFGPAQSSGRAWLGVGTRSEQSRLVVSDVSREVQATAATLNVDDEILAIDDVPVRAGGLIRRLEQYEPGSQVSALVARGRQLLRLNVTLGMEPARGGPLEATPAAAGTQLNRWLPRP